MLHQEPHNIIEEEYSFGQCYLVMWRGRTIFRNTARCTQNLIWRCDYVVRYLEHAATLRNLPENYVGC